LRGGAGSRLSELEPRAVVVTIADIRSLTWLEVARAAVIAGVKRRDWIRYIRAVGDEDAEPADQLAGALLGYAWAYVLVRRDEPGVTWDQAQTWDVQIDATAGPDPIAEAEADARVEAALATGLPPAIAGDLSIAELEAYETRLETARR
jgi:hypothetical protein